MQLAVFVTIFAVLVAVKANRCRKQEDCGTDECCLHKATDLFRGGVCTKLAKDGEKCTDGLNLIVDPEKFYLDHCPCASGLKCTPEKLFLGLKINETCVGDPTTKGPEITTQEEIASKTTLQEETTPAPVAE